MERNVNVLGREGGYECRYLEYVNVLRRQLTHACMLFGGQTLLVATTRTALVVLAGPFINTITSRVVCVRPVVTRTTILVVVVGPVELRQQPLW